MPDVECYKTTAGNLPPDTPVIVPRSSLKWFERIPYFDEVVLKFSQPRNYKLLKKWHKLTDFCFEYWEPEEKGGCKNLDTFRDWVKVRAGYGEVHITPEGNMRAVAKSISYASMKEEEFQDLYKKSVNVLWKWVLVNYTQDDIDRVLLELNGFD